MADTCARCGLPFRPGESREDAHMLMPMHSLYVVCLTRLKTVRRAAEAVCSSHETYGEMERDRDRLRDALRVIASAEPEDRT